MVTGSPRTGTTFLMNKLNNSDEFILSGEINAPRLFQQIENLFYREKNFKRKLWIKDFNKNYSDPLEKYLNIIPHEEDSAHLIVDNIYGSIANDNTLNKDTIYGDKYPIVWNANYQLFEEKVGTLYTLISLRSFQDTKKSYQYRANRTKEAKDAFPYKTSDVEYHWLDALRFYKFIHSDNKRVFYVKYEELCHKPEECIQSVRDFVKENHSKKRDFSNFKIRISSYKDLIRAYDTEEDFEKLLYYSDLERIWKFTILKICLLPFRYSWHVRKSVIKKLLYRFLRL